jgi:hypothetical protein
MKKLKLILALSVTGLITMSMGFPTDLASGRITDKNETKPCPSVVESSVVVLTNANPVKKAGNPETTPIQPFSLPSKNLTIIVKVFDARGKLVMTQQVDMEDFLRKSEKIFLPAGSTFVMLHESIAYYFLEAGLLN